MVHAGRLIPVHVARTAGLVEHRFGRIRMPKVRTGAAGKWSRRASAATEDFVAGVNDPRRDWQTATVAAEQSYKTGVQAAAQRGAFGAGVKAAGSEKWKRKTVSKGAARFSQGVTDAQGDYATAVAPYLQTIEQTALPPRGPKGDPANIQRVAVIAKSLRDKKLSLTGAK